jgi:hypothetical protein
MADTSISIWDTQAGRAYALKLVDNGDGTYSLPATIALAGDVEIGAVEIKDGAADIRQTVLAASTAAAAADKAAVVALHPSSTTMGAGAVAATTPRVTHASDDPAVATLGATSGAKVVTDANGTIQQYLRGLVTFYANALGAGTAAASTRVVQATDDTIHGALTETAPATDTASSGLNGRLQRIAQRLSTLITALGTQVYDSFGALRVNMEGGKATYRVQAQAVGVTANGVFFSLQGSGTKMKFGPVAPNKLPRLSRTRRRSAARGALAARAVRAGDVGDAGQGMLRLSRRPPLHRRPDWRSSRASAARTSSSTSSRRLCGWSWATRATTAPTSRTSRDRTPARPTHRGCLEQAGKGDRHRNLHARLRRLRGVPRRARRRARLVRYPARLRDNDLGEIKTVARRPVHGLSGPRRRHLRPQRERLTSSSPRWSRSTRSRRRSARRWPSWCALDHGADAARRSPSIMVNDEISPVRYFGSARTCRRLLGQFLRLMGDFVDSTARRSA